MGEKEKTQSSFVSKEEWDTLLEHLPQLIKNKKNKMWERIWRISLSLIALCSIIFISILIFIPKKLNIRDINEMIAKFDMLEKNNSSEYKILERDLRIIVEYTYMVKQRAGCKNYKRLSEEEITLTCGMFYRYIVIHQWDKEQLFALSCAESDMDSTCVGSAGERGILQIMPGTFQSIISGSTYKWNKEIKHENSFYNLYASLEHLTDIREYLRSQLKREIKTEEIAYAYNAGIRRVLVAINSGDFINNLPPTTLIHGQKVNYYYSNYIINNYQVNWWEYYTTKGTNK